MKKINGYSLTKQWFAFAFENPEKIRPVHNALMFWIIELSNSLGWKTKFGLPTKHTMDIIGVKDYRVYKKALDDLIDWEFIELLQKSKNQYTSNIIALAFNANAHPKAYTQIPDLLTQKTQRHYSHNKTYKTIEEIKQDFFVSIVDFLNERTKKKYKVTDSTKQLITDRVNEGYEEADFRTVIKNMTAQWIDSKAMNVHLSPDTLFSNKFEKYLNAQPIKTKTPITDSLKNMDHTKGLYDE